MIRYNTTATTTRLWGCVAGGAKKRIATRCLDTNTTLMPPPTVSVVSTISVSHPGADTVAYGNNVTFSAGGRTGGLYPSHINYSALPVQPTGTASSYSRVASTQPLQINYCSVPGQPHITPAVVGHSGVGARAVATHPSQLDYFTPNNDR